MTDFWSGKTACWVFLGCTEPVYTRCEAYQNHERPCWEVAATQCRKVLNFQWECQDCRVFKSYSDHD